MDRMILAGSQSNPSLSHTYIHRSAGGAALADPMPQIAAAHIKNDMSFKTLKTKQGGEQKPILSSVRVVPGSHQGDNGALYEPGTVLPQSLMPRSDPPTMVPVYSNGSTQR